MRSTLDDLLSLDRLLLADGATATSLWAAGLPSSVPVELWNASEPDRVESLHRAYIAAGADIILANTFGGNRHRLAAQGLEGRFAELNVCGVRAARRAAAAADRPVLVAGSVGPTGFNVGRLSDDDAMAVLTEQMQLLAEAGVEAIWTETLSSPAEMRAAARAAATTGLPFALTASLHTGCGLDPASVARLAMGPRPRPFAVGLNCGIGLHDLPDQLKALRHEAPGTPLAAKPSAGIPTLCDGSWRHPHAPADFARFARGAAALDIRILGGCCGTTPAHVKAMWEAVRNPAV